MEVILPLEFCQSFGIQETRNVGLQFGLQFGPWQLNDTFLRFD